MSLFNSRTEYGSLAKFFHWTVSILIITLLCVGFFMGDISDKPTRFQVYHIHKLVGLTVLTLVLLRMLWTLINNKPEYPDTMPAWQVSAARISHMLLYLAILTMPLTGWLMSTAAGYAPKLFSMKLAMPFVAVSKPLAGLANNLHELCAYLIIGLLCVHVGAAIKHHIIDKDNILKRMLPGKRII